MFSHYLLYFLKKKKHFMEKMETFMAKGPSMQVGMPWKFLKKFLNFEICWLTNRHDFFHFSNWNLQNFILQENIELRCCVHTSYFISFFWSISLKLSFWDITMWYDFRYNTKKKFAYKLYLLLSQLNSLWISPHPLITKRWKDWPSFPIDVSNFLD